MFSAYGVLDKIANGGGAFVAGAILTAVAFPTAAAPGSVDPEILRNLALANLPIIVVFNLGSLAFLSRYALTRDDHEKNARVLAERLANEAGGGTLGRPAWRRERLWRDGRSRGWGTRTRT